MSTINHAEFAAASINAADIADATLAEAMVAAGVALQNAASHTYTAITEHKVKAVDIAAHLKQGNKDTVARLAIVGQAIMMEAGDFAPEAVSNAHFFRTLVNKCVSSRVGLPAMRSAISASADQASAASALSGLCTPAKAVTADEDEDEDGANEDEDGVILPDYQRLLAAAAALIQEAISCTPLAVTDDDTACLQSLADVCSLAGSALATAAERMVAAAV
jgi:hypothetical protein